MRDETKVEPLPVWIDGELIASDQARISVLTHSLHYGSGVFEGVRSYGTRIFENDRHMTRLVNSARLLGYELKHSVTELCDASEQLLRMSGIENAYIRPFAWRGSEDIDITGSNTKSHVAIALWQWPDYYKTGKDIPGVTLTRAKWTRPSPDMFPLQSKAAGIYIGATLNRQFAKEHGFADCVVLDPDGHVVEATVANIFMVKDGRLITPPPVFCLNGITRQCVLALARDLGVEAAEQDFFLPDLADADEVFLSGTAVEVTPVVRIDELSFEIGPVTRRLRSAYHELVGKTIAPANVAGEESRGSDGQHREGDAVVFDDRKLHTATHARLGASTQAGARDA
jgi:branched-chain amino acid aminotransferase